MDTYYTFKKEKGLYLEPYNEVPEFAFWKKDLWEAIEHIKADNLIILGGDLYEKDGDDVFTVIPSWSVSSDHNKSIEYIQKNSIKESVDFLKSDWITDNMLIVFVVVSIDEYIDEYYNKSL